MADNFETPAGSGGKTFASDEIGGIDFPRVKLIHGENNTNDGDVSSANPFPVTDAAGAALLTTIDADTSAMVVDLAAIEVLLTGIDTDTDAIKTDAAAIEVLLTTMDGRLATIDTDTGAIATSAASIDGKITACNTGDVTVASSALPTGAATETTLAAIAGYLDTEVQAIVTAIQLIDNTISGNEMQVDIVSSALPTGAATEATLSTLSGKITACNTGAVVISSGTVTANAGTNLNTSALALEAGGNLAAIATDAAAIEVLLGTIDADTSALAGAVAGTEVQVDIVASLPAGTNAIGKLAANSGVDIGDVDVLSLPALAAGTNLVGKVSAGTDLTSAYDGTTALTIKRATGVATAENANTMIAAVADKQIRVLALSLIATSTTAVTVYVYNGDNMLLGNDTNMLTLDMDGVGGPAGLVLPWNPGGWFQTDTNNEALAIDLSAATPVVWAVTYVEV